MPNYRRAHVEGGTYFFTAALAERHTELLTRHIEALRQSVQAVRQRHPFAVDAMVVLPDHLHCIWTLPSADSDFSTRWFLIKSAFSRAMPAGERRTRSRVVRGERGIWQRRFWEHVIRDERDLQAHVDYIHINPVKHGHVRRAIDWPYSSIHRHVRLGLCSPDWAAEPFVADMELE